MPRNAAAWNDRGAARMRMGQLVGALGDYTQAIQLSPRDPELYLNRGNTYAALGNYDYALLGYTRARGDRAGLFEGVLQPWDRRLCLGGCQDADADWRYGIAFEPDPWAPEAMIRSAGLGVPAVRAPVAGDHTGALTDLRTALTLETDPERPVALARLLRALEAAP